MKSSLEMALSPLFEDNSDGLYYGFSTRLELKLIKVAISKKPVGNFFQSLPRFIKTNEITL